MDELRRMRGKYWIPEQESMIATWQELLTLSALKAGRNVVVDATNLKESRRNTLFTTCAAEIADLEIETNIFDLDPISCIRRDSFRGDESVGADVIWRMFTSGNPDWASERIIPKDNLHLPSCYVFDIDGTLALMGDRSPFEWHKVGLDTLNLPVFWTLNRLRRDLKVILLSGRDSICREQTEQWLEANGLMGLELYMRPKGDMRKDSIVKKELYYKYIAPFHDVTAVFDDRNQVVDMWRKDLGISCFQVAEGDF